VTGLGTEEFLQEMERRLRSLDDAGVTDAAPSLKRLVEEVRRLQGGRQPREADEYRRMYLKLEEELLAVEEQLRAARLEADALRSCLAEAKDQLDYEYDGIEPPEDSEIYALYLRMCTLLELPLPELTDDAHPKQEGGK
jgi:hypothetical protein